MASDFSSPTTLPGPSLGVIVPTIGRPELGRCLAALAEQTAPTDRILVISDRPRRYDWCSAVVEGLRKQGAQGRWTVWDRDNLGLYGHAARNEALDHLATLEHGPDWCWSIDDDDAPTPGALDAIRDAIATESTGEVGWFLFEMIGGGDSHFSGVTIPNRGEYVLAGNVGTPMLVYPTACQSRFGLSVREGAGPPPADEPGYWGDLQMAIALREEYGDPTWVESVVAEIRPSAVVPAMLAPQ